MSRGRVGDGAKRPTAVACDQEHAWIPAFAGMTEGVDSRPCLRGGRLFAGNDGEAPYCGAGTNGSGAKGPATRCEPVHTR